MEEEGSGGLGERLEGLRRPGRGGGLEAEVGGLRG